MVGRWGEVSRARGISRGLEDGASRVFCYNLTIISSESGAKIEDLVDRGKRAGRFGIETLADVAGDGTGSSQGRAGSG